MQRGFFPSLFDISFTSFVTTKVIKVLYVLTLALLVLAYVVIAITLFTSGGETTVGLDEAGNVTTEDGGGNTGLGLLWLFVLGPLFLFFYTLLWRVMYELIIVAFRIFENTRDLLALEKAVHPQAAQQLTSPPPAAPPAPGGLQPPMAPPSPPPATA
jgi:hypothetical protein